MSLLEAKYNARLVLGHSSRPQEACSLNKGDSHVIITATMYCVPSMCQNFTKFALHYLIQYLHNCPMA